MLMPVAFQLARRTGTLALLAADADVVRLAARRHRHAGRHLAEHHRVARARGDPRRAVPACSTSRRSAPASRSPGVALPRRSAGGCCRATARARPRWTPPSTSRATPPRSRCPRTRRSSARPCARSKTLGEDEVEVIALHARRRSAASSPAGNIGAQGRRHSSSCRASRPRWSAWSALAKLKLARDDKAQALDAPARRDRRDGGGGHRRNSAADRTARRRRLGCHDRYDVNLLAVSRSGQRITQRLRSVTLRAGDVIVLQGNLTTMPETLGELRLPAARRARPAPRPRPPQPAAARSCSPPPWLLVGVRPGAGRRSPSSAPRVDPAAAALADAARGLRRRRVADPGHARRADPGQRRAAHDRRHRPDRRLAFAGRGAVCRRSARSR